MNMLPDDVQAYDLLPSLYREIVDAEVEGFTNWAETLADMAGLDVVVLDTGPAVQFQKQYAVILMVTAIIERLGSPILNDPHQVSIYRLSGRREDREAAQDYIEDLGGQGELLRKQTQHLFDSCGVTLH